MPQSDSLPAQPLLGDSKNKTQRWFSREMKRLERRVPQVKKVTDRLRQVPPTVRVLLLVVWLLWKILVAYLAFRFVSSSTTSTATTLSSASSSKGRLVNNNAAGLHFNPQGDDDSVTNPVKLLYIVTSLAEYDNGLRKTVRGRDRFGELMLPVLVDSVESLTSHPYDYDVDVYLITAYQLRPERLQQLTDRLPTGVGLQVWDDACPLGYDKRHNPNKIIPNTRTLARQHRYVIKDKLNHYDMFLAFEDDMRITGAHVKHYLQMSNELDRLHNEAPQRVDGIPEDMDPLKMRFSGAMTEDQTKRLVPGFIRVEVLVDESQYGAQTQLDPLPIDFEYPGGEQQQQQQQGGGQQHHIDPTVCCHVPNMKPNKGTPTLPRASDVIIWETSAKALGVRHMPGSHLLDWLMLMPGPGKRMDKAELIGSYWSGRDGAFDNKFPTGGVPDLIAQQGGWMATRDQILRLDQELCQGKFLPPFDPPDYYEDGQQSMNVEYWSGSYQFFTGVRGGCNMQRVVSMKPEHFSKHLIYHVANNKQKQLHTERMLRADNLYGQMVGVLKAALKAKEGLEA